MASVMRAGALSRGSALGRLPRTLGAVRRLNLHEYQSAQLMAEKGVNVPMGIAAKSVAEAVAAAAKIGDDEVVIKSQILAGGRGLGTFKNGFQGGVHVIKTSQVEEYAGKMLGQTLVTKQSGPEGKPVDTLLLAKKMQLVNEMYFAIMLDRATLGPMIIACSEGGTSIEDLAASSPEKIIKVPISIAEGITDAQAATVVDGLKVSGDKKAAAEQIKALYKLFVEADCTMVEVNPLAEDADGNLIAADAKVGFDDNASFRQGPIFEKRDKTQEDPREVKAAEWDLNYVGLDGNIGCMVNGAGLAMATMDIIAAYGGEPANFLDVGGSANVKQITAAFNIISADDRVKAILVNIFGGIVRCDLIAEGVVAAADELGVEVPLGVRLQGTMSTEGREILAQSNLNITPAETLKEAGELAVAAVKGA
jgi:succinyl-CoA synthetase beta subunit